MCGEILNSRNYCYRIKELKIKIIHFNSLKLITPIVVLDATKKFNKPKFLFNKCQMKMETSLFMSIKKKLFDIGIAGIRGSAGLFGGERKNLILSNLVEQLSPVYSQTTRHGSINFFCFGEIPLWRAETLLTKEPETIEWIDSFKEGEVLWDIGANIGCYSLYAAKKGISVFSFEPSAANFFLLQKNIEINQLDKKIQAFCLAFSDVSETGYLNMSSIQMGGAINTFGEATEKFEFMEDTCNVKFQQGILGFSIDEFIRYFKVPVPNHIKIDVDGIEEKIICGAKKTLLDKNVKSILIELDLNPSRYKKDIFVFFEESGFLQVSKKHGHMFDSGKFSSIYNCVFERI